MISVTIADRTTTRRATECGLQECFGPPGIRTGRVSCLRGEVSMGNIVLVAAAASQILYQAQVPTFGCNSAEDVKKLLEIRSSEQSFQSLLHERIVQGECVVFLKDALVEGSLDN